MIQYTHTHIYICIFIYSILEFMICIINTYQHYRLIPDYILVAYLLPCCRLLPPRMVWCQKPGFGMDLIHHLSQIPIPIKTPSRGPHHHDQGEAGEQSRISCTTIYHVWGRMGLQRCTTQCLHDSMHVPNMIQRNAWQSTPHGKARMAGKEGTAPPGPAEPHWLHKGFPVGD